MRRTVLVIAAIFLLPPSGHAQSRPAPDTPGETAIIEDSPPPPGMQMVDALRVLAVTSGIIGGFVAADIISGGVLTAPLLSGVGAATGAVGTAPEALGLRPVIATAMERPATAQLPNLRSTLGQALAPPPAGRP